MNTTMKSFVLLLSSIMLTVLILSQPSFLSHVSKPLCWSLPFTIYKIESLRNIVVAWLKRSHFVTVVAPLFQLSLSGKREGKTGEIRTLEEYHEVAEILSDMVRKDGSGSWPPDANHAHVTWPAPLQPYKEIYLELTPLLPQAIPSLEDEVNIARIQDFRQRFRDSLRDRVDLAEVRKVRMTEMVVWTRYSLTDPLASPSNRCGMLG
jgi:hypothetical protein